METIEEQFKLIMADGLGDVIKFSNTNEFLELNLENRDFLKNYGIISYEYNMPSIITDGILKKYDETLIQIGIDTVDYPYCIDINTNEFLFIDKNKNKHIINSSIKKFIETYYILTKFQIEIEEKEIYGEYWENENYKKYAQKLKELFLEVEPNIMEYDIWSNQVLERELGVI